MANTFHRTWQEHRIGHFWVSVHLDPIATGHALEHDAELAGLTQQLIEQADAHGLPVTWAVSDPAYSAATPRILRSAVAHELAILGDENWLGPTAGRTRFARELARRVSQARAAGIEVTTLVPRVAPVQRHIDLVVKQRISAVAGIAVPANVPTDRQSSAPKALHYGVWELPITHRLPAKKSRFVPGAMAAWATWRQIRGTAAAAANYHLVIDAPTLAETEPRAIRQVAWLFKRVAEWRTRGLISVETLGAAAARLSEVPAVSPQRSILRRAA